MHRSKALFFALALLPFAVGCSTHYIPNTDVEDTKENRKIISFCEKYRHAVELKDVGTLMTMAAPNYYEDGGNVDASDDIDYAGLREYLTGRFQQATGIRYEIRYRRVTKTKSGGVNVDYTMSASYRYPTHEGGEKWRPKIDDNRLELVPYQETYRIVAGM